MQQSQVFLTSRPMYGRKSSWHIFHTDLIPMGCLVNRYVFSGKYVSLIKPSSFGYLVTSLCLLIIMFSKYNIDFMCFMSLIYKNEYVLP